MAESKVVKVFIASPGDLVEERALFPGVLKMLDGLPLGGRRCHLRPLGSEYAVPGVGRPQEIINREQLMECDLFVMLLWKRWGTPSGKFSSGTEEEFNLALRRFRATGRPRVLVYIRNVPPEASAAPDRQLEKVLKFVRRIDRRRLCLHQRYDDPQQWKDLFTRHLIQLLSASLDKEWAGAAATRPHPRRAAAGGRRELLRLRRQSKRENALRKTAEGKLRHLSIEHAVEAVRLAGEGKLSMAEEEFARAVATFEEPEVLNSYGLFLFQRGSPGRAKKIFHRLLRLTSGGGASAARASAYGNIGIIRGAEGDLKGAEVMLRKALALNVALGSGEGMASAYLGLGNVSLSRGALDRAEGLFEKGLEIYLEAGHGDGAATAYGSLGNVRASRGEFEEAERMYAQALRLDRAGGRKAAIANTYCNLGNVYLSRGLAARAERAYRAALRIDESLGRREGIADGRLNLGVLHAMRGDFDKARRMLDESLALNTSLGRVEGMANVYLNLGNLSERQGRTDEARECWGMALKIYEGLGCLEQAGQLKAWLAAIGAGGRGKKTVRGGRPRPPSKNRRRATARTPSAGRRGRA